MQVGKLVLRSNLSLIPMCHQSRWHFLPFCHWTEQGLATKSRESITPNPPDCCVVLIRFRFSGDLPGR